MRKSFSLDKIIPLYLAIIAISAILEACENPLTLNHFLTIPD